MFVAKKTWRRLILGLLLFLGGGSVAGYRWFVRRYAAPDEVQIPVREFSNAEYPEDPATRSIHFGQYLGRKLKLVRRDPTHFDFEFQSDDRQAAGVVFHNVDVGLMTPGEPAWTKNDPHLERIALTDRQWNRQQVSFDRQSPHLEVSGGDGFEQQRLASAELAKNCLNAGLWEVLLYTRENDRKALYYHGWFTFPLGLYKEIFERQTGVSYWKHWYKLEHWSDPAGTPVDLDVLREVKSEREVSVKYDPKERILAAGEQAAKRRTILAGNVRTWGDLATHPEVRFASFVPPGRYDLGKPWKHELWRIARPERAVWREIASPAGPQKLHELELVFRDVEGEKCRFLVSGFDVDCLPQLPLDKYPQGFSMPMGIGVPPFFQSYAELQTHFPHESAYFCVLLDPHGRWLNHHEIAIDGPVMHRDAERSEVLHVYFLSYERHSLVNHLIVELMPAAPTKDANSEDHRLSKN